MRSRGSASWCSTPVVLLLKTNNQSILLVAERLPRFPFSFSLYQIRTRHLPTVLTELRRTDRFASLLMTVAR